MPIPSSEIYQTNILTEDDLKLILDASEKLSNDVIDAYLEMLTRDNAKHFGFIPTYVIYCFRSLEKIPQEWLKNILQLNVVYF